MASRSFVVTLALVAAGGASSVHAAPPSATPASAPAVDRGDHRGFLLSAMVSAGRWDGEGLALGAEASVGWGVTPWLAVLSRGAVITDFGSMDGGYELQLAARLWPGASSWFSFELHGGALWAGEPQDCFPATDPNDVRCTGGQARGYSIGGAARFAVARGRHASFDIVLAHDELRWQDPTDGNHERHDATRLGLGVSFY